MSVSLTPKQRERAGELLREAASALRGMAKEASQAVIGASKKVGSVSGPVIDIRKLKELIKK